MSSSYSVGNEDADELGALGSVDGGSVCCGAVGGEFDGGELVASDPAGGKTSVSSGALSISTSAFEISKLSLAIFAGGPRIGVLLLDGEDIVIAVVVGKVMVAVAGSGFRLTMLETLRMDGAMTLDILRMDGARSLGILLS
jgi:hypothetical protein